MHSIRIQLLAFIMAVLLIFLVVLNIYPITSSRDLIFEEKRSALAGQASVVASSLSGLDRLAPESVREVLQLLDLGGYSRTVVAGTDGTVLYAGPEAGCAAGEILFGDVCPSGRLSVSIPALRLPSISASAGRTASCAIARFIARYVAPRMFRVWK